MTLQLYLSRNLKKSKIFETSFVQFWVVHLTDNVDGSTELCRWWKTNENLWRSIHSIFHFSTKWFFGTKWFFTWFLHTSFAMLDWPKNAALLIPSKLHPVLGCIKFLHQKIVNWWSASPWKTKWFFRTKWFFGTKWFFRIARSQWRLDVQLPAFEWEHRKGNASNVSNL